jgi:hypothetical protein
VEFEFTGVLWYWKGPAPFHFVSVPKDESAEIAAVAASVTYGWGMIPVEAVIGETIWMTSLFPKGDIYIVPIKKSVRDTEDLQLEESITIKLRLSN